MVNFKINKRLLVFLDETGDHSLKKIDKDFPIFAIAGAIFEDSDYKRTVRIFNNFKLEYFHHEGLILHSREIADRSGDFKFLHEDVVRKQFLSKISEIVEATNMKVCASAIKKVNLVNKYKKPYSPYDLAFSFIFEKVFNYACDNNVDYINFITEARGPVEDKSLHETFNFLRRKDKESETRGFPRFINQNKLDKVHVRLEFRKKITNIVGLQIADLIVSPIAQTVLKGKMHPSLMFYKDKFINKIKNGLKVFP